MPAVELHSGGRIHEGFASGSITVGMEQLASTFELEYVESVNDGELPWFIERGDECKLVVEGEELFVGWVEESDPSHNPDEIRLRVAGRSKTGDLVDCATIHRPGQWSNVHVDRIVRDIIEPFGLTVVTDGSIGPALPTFSYKRGETVQDTILRATKQRGLLAYSARGDEVVLARAGATRTHTAIEYGVNLVRGRRTDSDADRFSEYHFAGQTRATDTTNGRSASQLRNVVHDQGVRRYRPTYVVANGQSGEKDLGKRAILERNQRAGRGERVSATVDGWKTSEGRLWRPNVRARVIDPVLRVDAELLIVSVAYRFGPDQAPQVDLELTRPEAFEEKDYPLPTKQPRVRRADRSRYMATSSDYLTDPSAGFTRGAFLPGIND